MNLRVEILARPEDLAAVAPAWEHLASATGSPIDSPLWHDCAIRHVHSGSDQLQLVLLWNADRLVGVAPMVRAHEHGGRLELIGSRVLYEPTNVLADSAEAAAGLVDALASLARPLLLTRIDAEGKATAALELRARRKGWLMEPRASGTPYIDLAQGWEAYYAALPSRLRNIIRRGERQLAKSAPVTLEVLRPGTEGLEALLERAFQVEARSWKGRAGSAVLSRPDLRNFFFDYARRIAARGQLLVAFLRAGDIDVAMQVANVSAGAFWQLKIGYDERYAKQLIGLQLQLAVIRWSFEQGLRRYEFMGTAQPWIRDWTASVHRYRTFLFYPRNLAGLSALLADGWARLRSKLFVTSSTPRQAGGSVPRDPADSSDKMTRLTND